MTDGPSPNTMAWKIACVGRGYWVQTPSRWFPVEAHTMTPLFQFLPKRWQARLARNFTVWGWLQRPGREEARGFVENFRLLSARDLAKLFPEASVERERVLSVTKSFSAVGKQGG